MQQCPTCGSLNPDNADVCADCGMELPGHGATPATPQTPAAAPATPQTPAAAAPFDFAPEAAPTPGAVAPAPSPAPVEASGSDPFAGSQWDFDLDKGNAAQPPATPETPAVEAPSAPPMPAMDAPLPVAEPATPPPATPTPPSSSTPAGGAKLILKRGGAPTGDVFPIGQSATIGRFDPESGPVDVDMANLPEAVYISRHHAEINFKDGQWMVKDLGSRNGTFVKNASGFARATGEMPVTSGDEIAFGNARFEFHIL